MMRRTYFKAAPAALLCLLTASCCGQAQNTAEPQTGTTAPQTTAAASVQTTAPVSALTTAGTETQTAESVSETPDAPYGYVHGDEGYFSLAELRNDVPVIVQDADICWVVSAAAAMQYSSGIGPDPLELLDAVYYHKDKYHSNLSDEGWFPAEQLSPEEVGGRSRMIAEAVSNRISDFLLTEANDYTGCEPEVLKDAIRNNKAISISVPDSQNTAGSFGEYYTVNFPDPDESDYNYAVTIIGWDDHFPKDYFRIPASQDGAWLVQNSISEEPAYCWLSYDTPFLSPYSFSVSSQFGPVFSRDGGCEKTISTGGETVIAELYHSGVSDAGVRPVPARMIAGIGTYTTADNQKITVEIRDGNLEEVLAVHHEVFPVKGYHLIRMQKEIGSGDYSVVIRYEGEAPVEGESFSDDLISYRTHAEPGQSYVLLDGAWADLALPETAERLGTDFIPNNACVKVVFQKVTTAAN